MSKRVSRYKLASIRGPARNADAQLCAVAWKSISRLNLASVRYHCSSVRVTIAKVISVIYRLAACSRVAACLPRDQMALLTVYLCIEQQRLTDDERSILNICRHGDYGRCYGNDPRYQTMSFIFDCRSAFLLSI